MLRDRAEGKVTKLRANYLSLTGYRLPTEAEWEYACRAGAVTSRYYGETEELLGKYAWYLRRMRKAIPGRWGASNRTTSGLFDMHGNVSVWCQELHKPYIDLGQKPVEDCEDGLIINERQGRVLRGFSFIDDAGDVRCADRGKNVPSFQIYAVGFRLARTATP